jgi:hypothetical protein
VGFGATLMRADEHQRESTTEIANLVMSDVLALKGLRALWTPRDPSVRCRRMKP